MLGGTAYGADPGAPQDALQHQRDPDQPDAGLCRAALPRLAGARPLARPARASIFPRRCTFDGWQLLPTCSDRPLPCRASSSRCVAAVVLWLHACRKHAEGLRDQRARQSPRAGRFAGFSLAAHGLSSAFLLSGALAGLAGISRSPAPIGQLQPTISPGYGFTAIIVAFLGRLNPLGIVVAGLVLALTYLGGEAAQISLGVSDKIARGLPGHAAVLRARLRHADPLPHPLLSTQVAPRPQPAE